MRSRCGRANFARAQAPRRRTLRGVNLDADRVADLADRPLAALTRRDVALALLSVPSAEALASLPGIRRGLLAAGNPLSAMFWSSAEAVLQKISDGSATVGAGLRVTGEVRVAVKYRLCRPPSQRVSVPRSE